MPDSIARQGVPASQGIAIGHALLWDPIGPSFDKRHIGEEEVMVETQRIRMAIEATQKTLTSIKKRFQNQGADHLSILEAQEVILRDPTLIGGIEQRIRDEKINAEWALLNTSTHIKEMFVRLEQPFFRERQIDVESVVDRIMVQLVGEPRPIPKKLEPETIIIARSLSPIDAIEFLESGVVGIATDHGSHTAHTSIVARSLEIPAVVALGNITEMVGNGDAVILDGDMGIIIANPSEEDHLLYEERRDASISFQAQLQVNRLEKAETLDGHEVILRGNIDFLEEVESLQNHGGEGIGLLRTEYLFLGRSDLPDEETQFAFYKSIVHEMAPAIVTFRTLDLGGDKFEEDERMARALNRFFDLRAIRYCLEEKSLFKVQLRALLRASAEGPCRILIPFISNLPEVQSVKEILSEVKEELRKEGLPFDPDIPLGIMIEVPSAALIADHLSVEVDFFSVGTNDLIQFTLALSREQDEAQHLYHPLHPALLRLLTGITEAGQNAKIPVAMCGEMAGVPLYTQILLAMGFSELSMCPRNIPLVKQIIRGTSMEEANRLLEKIQQLTTSAEIEALVHLEMVSQFPDLIPVSLQK